MVDWSYYCSDQLFSDLLLTDRLTDRAADGYFRRNSPAAAAGTLTKNIYLFVDLLLSNYYNTVLYVVGSKLIS